MEKITAGLLLGAAFGMAARWGGFCLEALRLAGRTFRSESLSFTPRMPAAIAGDNHML